MSSLNSILNIASSGLQTAQTQLRVTSDNISNVSTPGYVRKQADQQSVVTGGVGSGVAIAQFRLVADKFLQSAGLNATSDSAAAEVTSDILDRAQSAFGDPNADTSFFKGLDAVFSGFTALSSDASATGRSQALASVQGFLSSAQGLAANLQSLGGEVDSRIGSDVTSANSLLQQIDALNTEIARGTANGADVTGSQNQQSGLIDQLSKLVDVRVTTNAVGGAVVRAADGTALEGEGGPATLRYEVSGSGSGRILLTPGGGGAEQPIGGKLSSGEIKGLLNLKNTALPNLSDGLSNLVSTTVAAINTAHNANSSVPAPQSLTGRATGQTAAQAFGSITTGKTAVLITDATGVVSKRVDVDFSVPSYSVDGGAAVSFTRANFATALNTALGASGSASFDAKGSLKISAAAAGSGVAIADDATTPVNQNGQGFSAAFGLNDLITSPVPLNYATGLTAASPQTFSGQISLRINAANGTPLREATITPPAGGTVGDLVTALNASTTGVSPYGAFALDGSGRLAFTPAPGSGVTLDVTGDTTADSVGGASLTTAFGLDAAARGARINGLAIRSDIAADPNKLALAKVQAGATAGATALYATDHSGSDALAQAGLSPTSFAAAGGIAAFTGTPSDYGAQFSAALARSADSASSAKDSADAVSTEATARRTSVEGVSLDEELVSLTTYQQSYNASARLIQAVKDLYDTLLQIV